MRREPVLRIHEDELIVDNFAGGGGASVGIEWALGRSPDIAINHDPEAIAMHKANHPNTRHYVADVFDVNPREAVRGKKVGLAWFSPDCTFFSKARGAKPFRDRGKARKRRGLAGVVLKWAATVKPRIIAMENVEEFQDWGPLDADGKPCPLRKGFNFRRFVARLENLGYVVELRELRACDFGAPTTRKRLYILARCDGQPIVWPEATHGFDSSPYRTAAECIDWSIPAPSIFLSDAEVKQMGLKCQRPLSDKTLRRIALGVKRYVLEAAQPFVVPLCASDCAQPRVLDIHAPVGTIMAGGIKHSLVMAFLAKHYGGEHKNGLPKAIGSAASAPLGAITTRDHNHLVTAALEPYSSGIRNAFMLKYFGTDQNPTLDGPLHTITTKHRFGLVTVHGVDYQIVDIGMRMLEPRELYRAQGFAADYNIEPSINGRRLSKTAQVRMVGNSCSPYPVQAMLAANFAVVTERKKKVA